MLPDELTWTRFPAASIPVRVPLPAMNMLPDEVTLAAPPAPLPPAALIPVPPSAREMLLDELTWARLPSASIPVPLPATKIFPADVTVAAPPVEDASIALPLLPIAMMPDEFTVAPPAPDALIPVPFATEMLPEELTSVRSP